MRSSKKPLIFLFMAAVLIAIATWFFASGPTPVPEQEEHAHESAEEEHGDAHGESSDETEISEASAATMGIETIAAGPATIRETVRLSGRVVLNQNRSAEVKARFPGVVRSVTKQVGDRVVRGEKLATVESNDSLQVYAVPAPLDGVMLERNISVGDTTGEAPVFVVADLASLWAEFFIFAGDMASIQQGQKMVVRTLDGTTTAETVLQTIQPTAEASSQTILARVELDNSTGAWRSGMTVQGDAVTKELPVTLAVPTAAIQRMDGNEVVFVREGNHYAAVPITTGLADMEMTEVTQGLEAGALVVSKNSFVVKADIGKAGAEHEH